MTKRALVVGINDYSAQHRRSEELGLTWGNLQGCVNDANAIFALLGRGFGFDQINLLTNRQATRSRILGTLRAMMVASRPGDVVCFYYSGHGGILPASRAADNTRFYEAIIPAEGDWIFDVRITQMAEQLRPSEVNFTLIMDSCHSGGMHAADASLQSVPRSVPMEPATANLIAHIQTLIPCGACLPPGSTDMDNNVSNPTTTDHGFTSLDQDPNKVLVASSKATLLSACQYWETALEVNGRGLLTNAILDTVNRSNFDDSYDEVLDQVRSHVRDAATAQNHIQVPQLYGQLGRTDEPFLQPWTNSE